MIRSIISLWQLMSKSHKERGIILIFLLVLGAAFELASVGVLLPTIQLMQDSTSMDGNVLFQKLNGMLGLPADEGLYIVLLAFVLAVFVVKSIVLLLINRYQFNYFAKIQSELSVRLFAKYLLSDYKFFFEANSSVLVRSVTEDIKNVVVLIIFASITIVTELFVAIPLFLFLVWLNPLVSGLTLLMGGVCFYLISIFVSKQLKPLGAVIQADLSKLIQNVQEGVGGIKELKVLARESFFLKSFEQRASSYAFGLGLHLFLNTIPRLILELMFVLIFLVVLLVLSFEGSLYDSLPMLAVYAAASFRLIPGLNRAAAAFNSFNMGQASLEVMVEGLSDDGPVEKLNPVIKTESIIFESLSVNSVTYDYPNGKKAIREMSFEIQAGEIIGIIGPSGAGKTTLMDLLLGLLKPNNGEIQVNKEDIHNNIKYWQSLIGYVTQNIFLVDGSIRNNIALGLSDTEISDTKVWEALRKANLEAFVKSIPDGLDTQVGERGVKFSGGQRQRIGIARALYRDPPVLVLDEATSALDGESEQEVIKEVALLKGRKTIIIIAHRITSLSACDRILEIENGGLSSVKSYAEIV